jgi:uncharacterized protein YqgV (UPF0045/DUF77 family)
MLLELSVTPKRKTRQGDDHAAAISRIIDSSGVSHRARKNGTLLEGSWDQLLAVARKCHDEALKTKETFVTVMRAVDGPNVPPCDRAAKKDPLEDDDGDWLIP